MGGAHQASILHQTLSGVEPRSPLLRFYMMDVCICYTLVVKMLLFLWFWEDDISVASRHHADVDPVPGSLMAIFSLLLCPGLTIGIALCASF